MGVVAEGEGVGYWSERRGGAGEQGGGGEGEKGGKGEGEHLAAVGGQRSAVVFRAHYRPISPIYAAVPGTLEHFLTERYCLYAQSPNGVIRRTEIHHGPWPLQRAEVEVTANTVSAAGGLAVSGPPALLHFSRRIDMVLWRPKRVLA